MESSDLVTNSIVIESLRKNIGSTAKLIAWNLENCNGSLNFFNEVRQLNVRYSMDEIEREVSYVAKLNPCKTNDLFNPYRERAMRKEVFFYKELLPVLNSELEKLGCGLLNVPKYIYSSIEAEKEVIILEDLKSKGYVAFSNELHEMDEAHSQIMAREISKLHVASFALERALGNKKLEEVYPLLVETWLVGDIKLRSSFEELFKKGLNHNLKLTKTLAEFEELLPWLKSLKNKEMEELVKEITTFKTSGRVICHGDYHRSNVLFRYDESNIPVDLMIIDWQTIRVANLGSEISYLLFSSIFGPIRSTLRPLIIKSYYEALKPFLGPKNLTLKSIEEEIESNRFGFLICFYLFPLSFCVSSPSEFFKIEKTCSQTVDEEEELKEARELLEVNHRLSFVLKDYLNHASKTFLKD